MQLPPESSEQRSEMLDPHRTEDRQDAATEIAGRLAQKGLDISATEDSALLADLLSAVERFEAAVIWRGGDPMVNMPDSTDPEDPAYVLPSRSADESLEAYITQVGTAAAALEGPRLV
ncbi:MAG: hypothetical protein ABIR58_02690 [Gemmatimonadaceae bacterium]